MRVFPVVSLTLAALVSLLLPAHAQQAPSVVVSIKPIHSLVAGVMGDTGTPELIVDGAASPHTFSLNPKMAEALQQADIVFWIGPDLENFLVKPLQTIAEGARNVPLLEAPGMIKLDLREGTSFEVLEHEEDHEEDHEEHAEHGDKHEESHEEEHDADHDHESEHAEHRDDAHDHHHGDHDPHVWLDPQNAKAAVEAIRLALTDFDPDQATTYQTNADLLKAKLDGLVTSTGSELASVKDQPFMVFHDGYQYFEKRFGLAGVGAIVINPDTRPSAERIQSIRERMAEADVVCVFSEPQFEPRIVSVAIEGTEARTAVLDPLGSSLTAGPDHYFDLIDAMTESFQTCLSGSS